MLSAWLHYRFFSRMAQGTWQSPKRSPAPDFPVHNPAEHSREETTDGTESPPPHLPAPIQTQCEIKWELTPHIILVCVVDLLNSAVSESEFPHPVHPSVDPWPQAQRSGPCWALETIWPKVVSAAGLQYQKGPGLDYKNILYTAFFHI